jgi:molybdenum cofactor guanylyltransferase
MKILGAILAGGQSRRFGSDKAEALFQGKALLDHAADALRPQCAELVIAGRDWPGIPSVADYPDAGLGPLGGLAGALHYAERNDFDSVLSCGCDVLGLPENLVEQLGAAPVILDKLPIIGLWPASLSGPLAHWLNDPAHRSVYRFADYIAARRAPTPGSITNINRESDLVEHTKHF